MYAKQTFVLYELTWTASTPTKEKVNTNVF
jgi:hypothetical protein